jgi:hypothetical protein
MNYTNLNIKSNGKTFKYIVEYFDDPNSSSEELQCIKDKLFGYFFLLKGENNISYQKNYYTDWINVQNNQKQYIDNSYIPDIFNISSFDLYFPRYSVETYEKNVYYALTLNTWINGVPVYLGSFLIDRKQAIAPSNGKKVFLNDDYYEYVRIHTIDPYYLIYSDDWKDFRKYYCGEKEINGKQKNNSASNINITITPIKKLGDDWVKLDGYDNSQSVIVLNTKNDNYLSAKLKFDIINGDPKFICNTVFNSVYEGNLEEYLEETYQIEVDDTFNMKYCFVIGDKDNPYKYEERTYNSAETECVFGLNDFSFNSWDDYIEGLYANVYTIIQKNDEDIIVLISNKVYINQEIFKYLFKENIRKIDLENIDMNTNNLNVVNVIENKIVTLERPNEYKSNIIKPIFVKVQETDSIRVHKSVTENICINLDAYKNKVDAFILKIGDTNFYEIGRINSGVIFKVIGSNIQLDNGIYYILNNEGELVTTGKFTAV